MSHNISVSGQCSKRELLVMALAELTKAHTLIEQMDKKIDNLRQQVAALSANNNVTRLGSAGQGQIDFRGYTGELPPSKSD